MTWQYRRCRKLFFRAADKTYPFATFIRLFNSMTFGLTCFVHFITVGEKRLQVESAGILQMKIIKVDKNYFMY